MNGEFNTPRNVFNNKDYRNYIVKYNNVNEFKNIEGVYLTPLIDYYGILTIRKDLQDTPYDFDFLYKDNLEGRNLYFNYPMHFTLLDISPAEASQVSFVQKDTALNLTGKDVTVGIVDTGIDYLNYDFIDDNGDTRIEFIWDQTIEKSIPDKEVPYGSIYNKDDINRAIKTYKEGGDPYSIVPSRDEIGHGTKMASLVGSRNKVENVMGMAPDCKFAIIKLSQDLSFMEENEINIPVYGDYDLITALSTLYRYTSTTNISTVILLPLGSNGGNHRGGGLFSEYIQKINNNRGICIVTGTGNEGDSGTHFKGIIPNKDETSIVELNVSKDQKNLSIQIWIQAPNLMTINLISPSGEETGELSIIINSKDNFNFIFEETTVIVKYFVPEEITGDELILVQFFNIKEGTWRFRLKGKIISNGEFNCWLLSRGITKGNTSFRAADPYGTITIPGDSKTVITAAGYDQNNNNTVNYSGVAFNTDYENVITIAAGSVNAKVIGPNNTLSVINGTSVSAAITAGACALLFQWGKVDGNYPYIYSQSIQTFLARGTVKRRGDIYPNPQWGYGILNLLGIFQNMT